MAEPFDAAVMHDYFVDRLVGARSLGGLVRSMKAKAAEGGGGIHGVPQSDKAGGNAVDLAHALARLGLRVLLVTHSDPEHERILRGPFEGLDAEVRVKPGPAGLTVAIEGKANVMLGESGGAASFGPEKLDEEDWRSLASARVVCAVNWAANGSGSELLSALRSRLGPNKTIFFDPADFRDRPEEFLSLMSAVGRDGLADWVSMNEWEGRAAAGLLGVRGRRLDVLCGAVAGRLGVSFDLHSERASYTSDGGGAVSWSRVAKVMPGTRTGAGDVWNAASIYGRLKGVPPGERVRLANAAAGLYLRSPRYEPPTLSDVLSEG